MIINTELVESFLSKNKLLEESLKLGFS